MSKDQLSVPNRYKNEFAVLTKGPDGTYNISISFRDTAFPVTNISGVRKHRVKKSDTLDRIALEYYSVPDLWYILADANPTLLFHPNDINNIVGKYIDIPPVNMIRLL